MNKVILIGNIGKIEEFRTTPAGNDVINFTLATNKKIKGVKKTEWHRCVAWSNTAGLINQYCNVGSKLACEGEIQTRQWEDKDGNKRYSTEIVVYQIEFLGGNKEQGQDARPHQEQQQQQMTGDGYDINKNHPADDDLDNYPF